MPPLTAGLPDPGQASNLDELTERLRQLKTWVGSSSYATITSRINASRPPYDRVGKTTVADCFRAGRRRLDLDLVTDVVHALRPDPGYVNRWRQAVRVLSGMIEASLDVRVSDTLPYGEEPFVGRGAVVDRLRRTVAAGRSPLTVLAHGMAGVGKTRLATRLGQLLSSDDLVDRTLFVDLRGSHPTQPPADPAAVLDGLEAPGHRALGVLDDAADEEQVTPLLAAVPGSVVVVTSRRALTLPGAVAVGVDPFTRDESRRLLIEAVGHLPRGGDRYAIERIADRCGQLPLALSQVVARMLAGTGWTLTDHADRLDERRAAGHADPVLTVAFQASYRTLGDGARRLLRATALHPGPAFSTAEAALLAGTDPGTAARTLSELVTRHLVIAGGLERFSLHDLVREFAAARSIDEDPRTDRQRALDRLHRHRTAARPLHLQRRAAARVGPVGQAYAG